ncbi:MAG: hypothetical protein WDN00_08315 [Limisphaerales bacterium]
MKKSAWDTAAEENVLFGLENLHSYHCVQERLMDGSPASARLVL